MIGVARGPKETWRKWSYLRSQAGFRHSPFRTLARLVIWRLHCLFGASATIQLRASGHQMFLPPNWRGMAKMAYLFDDRYYEPELGYVHAQLGPGAIFVDVGASLGLYTLTASARVGPSGRTICVEAASKAFAVLQHNVSLNGLDNVVPVHAALADHRGKIRLFHAGDPNRNTILNGGDTGRGWEEVEVTTLDYLLAELQVPQIDVMKIDIEGAEHLVLRGAQTALTSRPIIVFEYNGPEAWDLLGELGYRFYSASYSGTLAQIEEPPQISANVVAIHPSKRVHPAHGGDHDR